MWHQTQYVLADHHSVLQCSSVVLNEQTATKKKHFLSAYIKISQLDIAVLSFYNVYAESIIKETVSAIATSVSLSREREIRFPVVA